MNKSSQMQRSWNMSRVKSANTTPELFVRSVLHKEGYRFRLHVKNLPGKPDIVLAKYKTIVDVRGCFWHQHQNCKRTSIPTTNTTFWEKKLKRNVERDKKTIAQLCSTGWTVYVIWECELHESTIKLIHALALQRAALSETTHSETKE